MFYNTVWLSHSRVAFTRSLWHDCFDWPWIREHWTNRPRLFHSSPFSLPFSNLRVSPPWWSYSPFSTRSEREREGLLPPATRVGPMTERKPRATVYSSSIERWTVPLRHGAHWNMKISASRIEITNGAHPAIFNNSCDFFSRARIEERLPHVSPSTIERRSFLFRGFVGLWNCDGI